jgi:iron complex transport system substrate-binding protein
MLKIQFYIALCLLGLVCAACQPTASSPVSDDTVGFDISQSGDTTHITIHSPWQQGQVMAQYAMTRPLERVICTSATHIGFMHELELMDKVIGVCRPNRIYNLTDEQRANMIDIGDDIQPNMEAILLAKPDAVIISTYAEGDQVPAQIEALDIPVFYCNEWTETTPLARSEWIRFFGAIFGCLSKADSICASVQDAYAQLKVDSLKVKGKSIMSGMSWRGIWYVPTGGTFMGHLFQDASASYKYQDHPSTSSIPLTMEQAIQDLSQADVWVGCEANSLKELEAIDKKHTWFKAFQTGQVYNFRRRTLHSGANDFWESGTVHPEHVSQDLQKVLHGDTTDLYYIMRLK